MGFSSAIFGAFVGLVTATLLLASTDASLLAAFWLYVSVGSGITLLCALFAATGNSAHSAV